jgi:hypothetical protein
MIVAQIITRVENLPYWRHPVKMTVLLGKDKEAQCQKYADSVEKFIKFWPSCIGFSCDKGRTLPRRKAGTFRAAIVNYSKMSRQEICRTLSRDLDDIQFAGASL